VAIFIFHLLGFFVFGEMFNVFNHTFRTIPTISHNFSYHGSHASVIDCKTFVNFRNKMVNKSRRNNDGLEGILDTVAGVFDDLEEKAFMGSGGRKSAVRNFFSSSVGLGFPGSEGLYNQARQVYYTDLRDHDAEPSDHNTTGEDEQRDDRYASTSSERRQRASSLSHKQRRKSLSREGSSSFREEPLQTRISSQTSRANKVNKSAHRRPHGKSAIKTKADKTKATADKYSICEEKTAASSKPKNRGEESSDTLSYGWASDYSKFRKMLQENDGKHPGEEQQLSSMAKLLPKEQREDTQPKKLKNGKQTSTSKSKHSNTVVNSKPKQVSVVSESTPKQAAVSSTSKSKPELASVVSESKSKRISERSSSTPQPIQTIPIPNPKTLVSRESSQETYMDELRARLESCVTQREEPIESLMASRRAIQVEEQQVVEPMELAPPPKYSLSQVKQATVSPSSQDAFMNELKAWHVKYSLRKVPSEEKQRPKQANELQSTKFESAQDVQARPVEEKRAHAKSKKWGKFSMLFKRKQRSKQQKEGCFNVEETSYKIAEKEPTTAPQSLVEQRKKELESFFVAYTQTIHKDKAAAAASPTSSPAEQGNKESDYDETEEGTEVELSKGGSGVSQGVSSLTIPVPSAVVLTVASKGKKENVSELSSKENDQASGSGSVYSSSVDSRKENRNEQRGHDGHNKAAPTSGVTWKDIQPNKVVVVTKRQRSTPPPTPTITNDSTIKQREVAWEGGTTKQRPTTNKPRGDNRKSKDKSNALRTSSKSKQNTNNTKSRRRSSSSSSNNNNGKSNTTAISSTRKPSSTPRGASLFGNNNGRCTMPEAERRRRERKARLSQTLF
jgi:hypothetical protein